MKLIDQRTADGSRHFSRFPQVAEWDDVRDHALRLPGAEMINFVESELAQRWLDFRFRGHRFLVRSRRQHLDLFVDDPHCHDLILYQVGRHFERLGGGRMKDETGVH